MMTRHSAVPSNSSVLRTGEDHNAPVTILSCGPRPCWAISSGSSKGLTSASARSCIIRTFSRKKKQFCHYHALGACRTCISPCYAAGKNHPFASGNEADVRQTRRSAFGRPQVDPKGAVQGRTSTQTRRSAFGRPEVGPKGAVQGRTSTQTRRSAFGRPEVDPKGAPSREGQAQKAPQATVS